MRELLPVTVDTAAMRSENHFVSRVVSTEVCDRSAARCVRPCSAARKCNMYPLYFTFLTVYPRPFHTAFLFAFKCQNSPFRGRKDAFNEKTKTKRQAAATHRAKEGYATRALTYGQATYTNGDQTKVTSQTSTPRDFRFSEEQRGGGNAVRMTQGRLSVRGERGEKGARLRRTGKKRNNRDKRKTRLSAARAGKLVQPECHKEGSNGGQPR